VLVGLSVFFEGAAIALNVLGYIYFSQSDSCGDTLWVNIVNTIILIILPVLQFFNFNKQNSLLTTALVSMYVSYLSFICQFSFGGSSCTSNDYIGVLRMTTPAFASDVVVSTAFFILTMYGSIMGGSGQVKIN
jgi:ABC-type antimicrobial peptide transport system permease subunit